MNKWKQCDWLIHGPLHPAPPQWKRTLSPTEDRYELFVMNTNVKHADHTNEGGTAEAKTADELKDLATRAAVAQDPGDLLEDIRRCGHILGDSRIDGEALEATGILPAIIPFLSRNDNSELQKATAWFLTMAAECSAKQVAEASAVPKLVHLLANQVAQRESLSALASILMKEKEQIQVAIDNGFFSHMRPILTLKTPLTVENATRILSEMAAGTEQQRQALIEANVLPIIEKRLGNANIKIKKESARVFCGLIIYGTKEQKATVISRKVILYLNKLLMLDDTEIVKMVLDCFIEIYAVNRDLIREVFNECADFSRMNELEEHENEELSTKATKLMERLDDCYDSEDDYEPELGQLIADASEPADSKLHLRSLTRCTKLINEEDGPIHELIKLGLIPILVECISSHHNDYEIIESSFMIYDIVIFSSEFTQKVLDAGAVPALIKLFQCDNEDVAGKALDTIGSIMGRSEAFQKFVFEAGIVKALLSLVKKCRWQTLGKAAELIITICNFEIPPLHFRDIIIILKVLIRADIDSEGDPDDDSGIPEEAVKAIAAITKVNAGSKLTQMIVDADFVPILVSMLSKYMMSKEALLEAIGYFAAGTDAQKKLLLGCNLFRYMREPLTSYSSESNYNAAISIVTLVAGDDPANWQRAFEDGLLPMIVERIARGLFQTYVSGMSGASGNSGTNDHVATRINSEIIPALCTLLDWKDFQVVNIVLIGLSIILKQLSENAKLVVKKIEECGGFQRLKLLKSHENKEIRNTASRVLYIAEKAIKPVEPETISDTNNEVASVMEKHLDVGIFQMYESWATSSLRFGATKEQLASLISLEVIPRLCKLLVCEDKRVVHMVLESLNALLELAGENTKLMVKMIEDCGGVNMIAELKMHEDATIKSKASETIEKYLVLDRFGHIRNKASKIRQQCLGGISCESNPKGRNENNTTEISSENAKQRVQSLWAEEHNEPEASTSGASSRKPGKIRSESKNSTSISNINRSEVVPSFGIFPTRLCGNASTDSFRSENSSMRSSENSQTRNPNSNPIRSIPSASSPSSGNPRTSNTSSSSQLGIAAEARFSAIQDVLAAGDDHDVLGVPRGADRATIEVARARLLALVHPDKNKGNKIQATQAFIKVNAAYEALV